MALIERIITVYNDKGSKQAVKDVNKLEKSFKEAGKKIAKAFLVAGAAAGALAIKVGKDAVDAAMADQKSQLLLANALRNTVGATDSTIAATENYISAMQAQFNIADDDLRPSLAALAAVTRDVGQAQTLQNIAIDTAAGSGLELASVTRAIVKAYQGNIGALRKLGVPLSDNIIKSKDFGAAMQSLSKQFTGSGKVAAETFEGRLRGLQLAYGEIIEELGYALIPVLSEFAATIRSEVLPVLESFISANKDQIAKSLADAADGAMKMTRALFKFFKLIADNIGALKVFTALIIGTFVGAKVAAGIEIIAAGIAGLILLFKRQAVAAGAAGTATALATGGATAVSAAAGLAAFGAAAAGTIFLINKFTDSVKTSTTAVKEYNSAVVGHLADLKNIEKATAANVRINNANIKSIQGANNKTKEQILLEKTLAKLKKQFGVTPASAKKSEENEAINIEAARLNLVRQNKIAESERAKAMLDNLAAQMRLNEAAQRYADLLQVLSDAKISSQEVSVLAQKWNMTKGEVLEYIARIYAANSTDLDSGPVIELLMAWGLTREQAAKYVDFTRALKDEKLDDSEIEKLMGKWQMTRAEVLYYAKQVQAGTTFSTSWDDPGKLAEQSWLDALAALNAYLTALKSQTPQVPVPVMPGAGAGAGGGAGGGAGAGDGISAVPVVGKIAEEIASLTALRSTISSSSALGFKLKEQIDALSSGMDLFTQIPIVDERTKLQQMGMFGASRSRFDVGSFRAAEERSMNVTVNVGGNVISESDLTATIRDNILQGQKQGEAISFNTIAI